MSIHSLISSKKGIIGIIGLGYVGLPLAIRFSEVGFTTFGFDIDPNKIKKINKGKSYINHIENDAIINARKNELKATNDFSLINKVDVIIVCVPTPLGQHNEPNLEYISGTLESINPYIREQQLLILESTTYPGTTEEEIIPFIEKSGFQIGENYFIGYSPEREDPGNLSHSIKTITKVVSGHTRNCLKLTKLLYENIVDKTAPVSSTKVAEMTKILENIHRAVNIGLVNELKMVSDKMGIDIYEVINAAATKPFGFTPFYPGPGLGGHCIPIDPFYLTWKAKEVGMNTRFIELAGEINSNMPNYVVTKSFEALNSIGKSIKSSKILVLGLAYKKNIDDTRESPSLVIIDKLLKMGAMVDYSDPYLLEMPETRKYNFQLKSIKITKTNVRKFDLIILATAHDDINYSLIQKEAKLIIDTRGFFGNQKNIIKA